MQPLAARAATEDELAVYHTHEYIEGVRDLIDGGPHRGDWGEVEFDTPLSPGSFEAALYAAGGAINAVDAVCVERYAMPTPCCVPPVIML